MAIVGKNILDNLTTGMYSDSKVIYREYIQNACDQIDIAVESGLLSRDEGLVDIFIDNSKRYISVRDNATGVQKSVFVNDLGDIANSNKEIGKNKGFRGIGRLCGLAYCKTLRFSTSFQGENIKSIMTCDAQKMREMLIDNKKYTLDEIWDEIVSFSEEPENSDKHYFEVELFDINKSNTDLLDEKKVCSYLSFVAPVPYKNTFILRNQVYSHARNLSYHIDEYCIKVNGTQIFKDYTTRLKEQSGNSLKVYDEISKLEFHDFYDNNQLVAWMWVGLSRFEKQIPKINQMRGLRLRSGNIQLGNDDALQDLFKENRGNYYFVGEVFAVSKELIPNSQRDYFNENSSRVMFEDLLRAYFYDVLHKIYYDANKIKNAYKKQEDYANKLAEFEQKSKEHGFVDDDDKQKLKYDIEKAKKEAEDAQIQLKKFDGIDDKLPIAEVQKSIGENYKYVSVVPPLSINDCFYDSDKCDKKRSFVTDSMSKLSRNERKIVVRILTIINEIVPKDVSEKVIQRIKEEFK